MNGYSNTVTLVDGYLRGLDGGVIVERDGTNVGHWPMGMDEARERAVEEFEGCEIVTVEQEDGQIDARCCECGEPLLADEAVQGQDDRWYCSDCYARR